MKRLLVMLVMLVVIVMAGPARGQGREIAPTVARDQPAAVILSEAVICKQPGRYMGWPSIVAADNGDLLAVFSGERDWHVCPWGKVMLVRSTDGGNTWSEAEVVIDTPLDDRDTGLVKMADGSLVLSFNTSVGFDNPKIARYDPYREHAKSLTPEIRERWRGNWTMRSTDQGRTWSEPARAPVSTPHGPAALSDGRLVFVREAVAASSDLGVSWVTVATFTPDPATWKSRFAFLSEQHAVETADHRIVALSRYGEKESGDYRLRQTESGDGGRTWTAPAPTEMRGYPAHLLRLNNGWLVASYGRRFETMGEYACVSRDGGRTWRVDEEIMLSRAVPQEAADLGYPCSAQLPDGSIWTVYYQVEKEADGEHPCLMGTHWRLK